MSPATVKSCTARHDGGYLVILTDRSHGVSPVRLEPGARAKLSPDGRVVAG